MTLAVAALFAEGPTAIRDVYNWRVKETERMVAIVTELRKLGATARANPFDSPDPPDPFDPFDPFDPLDPPEQLDPRSARSVRSA